MLIYSNGVLFNFFKTYFLLICLLLQKIKNKKILIAFNYKKYKKYKKYWFLIITKNTKILVAFII